ncbi:uncharacterized protein TRAVEDRAFT_17987 [Trametes versicolor FP-101664 SS1]|uniref:uncharacterized protein n=1 Tax=Trametes versicolor (strain FP-101664) TaxID=717944 RepID=UPI0004621A4D|nr:uncharacterized protein TRAVEDRAFT_17987 [Trametes versicolor FP-101664 SS1]EIW61199.1 hypothetical protein TRAVEDRAFT_17987 [Trametes versicolor FP-101664 SS1]
MSLVDDSNPSVQYASGWIWDQGVAEVDATRHGANVAGLRAWLSFTVSVVGTLGPSDKYGQPKTTYLIDGQVAGSYSAPVTPSGETRYNVTFFSAQDLSPGDHIVLINNTDGTSPNTFWLDYFLIDHSPNSTSGSSSPTITPSPNTVSVSLQTVTSTSGTATVVSTVSVTVPVKLQPDPTSAANTSGSGSSSSHSNAGVIAGATIAGVALLVLLGVAFWWLRRRRRSDTTPGTVAPFTLPQDPFVSGHQPSMRYSTNTGATLPVSPAGSHFGHRPPTAPPSEVAPESVVSRPESDAPSASSGAGLLAPLRRTASPPSPSAPASYSPSPVSEKSQRTRSDPDTPSLAFSSLPGTGPESSYSQSGPLTPASLAFSSTSGTAPLMPPGALPPGAWHAPPDSHGRAHTLLRSLFSRGNRAGPRSDVSAAPRDVDSGLRLYDNVVLPPPYTQE